MLGQAVEGEEEGGWEAGYLTYGRDEVERRGNE